MPSAQYNGMGLLKNLWYTFRHRNKHGINHVTGDCNFIIFALLGCKSVLTVHDLGFYTEHLNDLSWFKRHYLYWFQIYGPIRLATRVVAITEKTKLEIEQVIPFKRRIDVVKHHSIDEFRWSPKPFNPNHIVVLQNGTGMNKNLETTIKAVAQIPNCTLRVVRKMTDEQKALANQLGVTFENVYDLTDEEVYQEYVQADIVCAPSWYEGFGAIPLEAEAVGRPVITTNREPMCSVSPNGAAYLLNDPMDVDEFVRALNRIIHDDAYRAELIQKGYANSRRFTVANCAKEHIDLYAQICSSN
jgi:glycosyltransferase involved in cell wall biosynthesis